VLKPVLDNRFDLILALPGLDGSFMKKASEVPERMIKFLSEDDVFSRSFPDVKNRSMILPYSPFHVKEGGITGLLKLLRLYKESANPESEMVTRAGKAIETMIRERQPQGPITPQRILAVGVSAGGQLASSLAARNANNPLFEISQIVTFGSPFVKGVLERVPETTPVTIHNSVYDRVVSITKRLGFLAGVTPEKHPGKTTANADERNHLTPKSHHINMFSYKNPEFKEKVFLPVMREAVLPRVTPASRAPLSSQTRLLPHHEQPRTTEARVRRTDMSA
jgi:hypothetical protein